MDLRHSSTPSPSPTTAASRALRAPCICRNRRCRTACVNSRPSSAWSCSNDSAARWHPTAAGERVVDAARHVLREAAEVVAVAASVSALVAGALEVVTLPTLAADPVGRLVGAFRRSHPGVVVRIEEADRAAEAEAWLRAGRVELAFTEVTTGGIARPRARRAVP